ncbi:MAG: nuclear transport factor 2 family protein [Pseudomonadota bacterium]
MKSIFLSVGLGALALAGCVYVDAGEGAYIGDALSEDYEIYDAEIAAIEAVLLDYFDGQGEASLERLQNAFHPNSSMFGVVTNDDGESDLRVWPKMYDVIDGWAQNENPPGAGRDGEVMSIEIVDGRLAVATFRYSDRFFDAFSLVKIDGEWKIAAKTFIRQ